ncbi:MAG: arginine--tRNA ligase [Fibrobacterota bacterium]
MTTIRKMVEEKVARAFTEAGIDTEFARVVGSNRPDLCQFQCNGALAVAKRLRRNPREIAQEVLDNLGEDPFFSGLSLAGPGFINISVTDEGLCSFCNETAEKGGLTYGSGAECGTVVVDFGGPNVAKPMHVGHLRSAIIGDSLQRLFRELGYTVISDNHLGDWGTQMGMLISELRRRRPELPYFNADHPGDYPAEPPITITELETMYPEASKKCKADETLMEEAIATTDELQRGNPGYTALWRHFVSLSVKTLKNDFARLGVSFDYWLGESFYMERMADVVADLRRKGLAEKSQGATVMDVSRKDDSKEIPPVMLEKSGGGFLYATSDIATIDYRVQEFGADRICYVVDKRQALHFEQVFRAVGDAGIVPQNMCLEHVGFGTVNGTDGKPYKTREGGVMKLADLISRVIEKARERMEESGIAADLSSQERESIAETVGLAALKYADLSNHRLSDYVFDIDKFSRFEGKTGPYILYSAVRIKSILRKAAAQGFRAGMLQLPRHDSERELMLELSRGQDVVEKASRDCAPNYLCDYVYDISQIFNRFYRDCHIMKENDPAVRDGWLRLCGLTLAVMEKQLAVLGIAVPERM